MPATVSKSAILRLTIDLVADEIARDRGRSLASLRVGTWTEATRLQGPELDCDSLDRLNLACALNEFFHLHEHGTEDYLLTLPRLGDWCDLVADALAATGTHLTFRTSGSTGTPKRCTHAIADLQAEAAGWAERLADTTTILAAVPAHHIYGTIFTALLPDRLGPDRVVTPHAGLHDVRHASAGTLIVATPTQWRYLAPAVSAGSTGVTSTAPMPDGLARELRGRGLRRLLQIYGSSETAGIAMREDEGAPYELLAGWSRAGEDLARDAADGARRVVAPPDRLDWVDERRFRITGRRDGAVQVGGYNVFPASVRDTLLTHAEVAAAAVRPQADGGRLKAFVVPATPIADPDRFAAALDRWCGERLTTAERPRHFTLGSALPVNAMGKPADW